MPSVDSFDPAETRVALLNELFSLSLSFTCFFPDVSHVKLPPKERLTLRFRPECQTVYTHNSFHSSPRLAALTLLLNRIETFFFLLILLCC